MCMQRNQKYVTYNKLSKKTSLHPPYILRKVTKP